MEKNNWAEKYATQITKTLNSFVLLSFEKMVILEVSMTGAMNMALRPDVKHKIV